MWVDSKKSIVETDRHEQLIKIFFLSHLRIFDKDNNRSERIEWFTILRSPLLYVFISWALIQTQFSVSIHSMCKWVWLERRMMLIEGNISIILETFIHAFIYVHSNQQSILWNISTKELAIFISVILFVTQLFDKPTKENKEDMNKFNSNTSTRNTHSIDGSVSVAAT